MLPAGRHREFLAEGMLPVGAREALVVSLCDYHPMGWDMGAFPLSWH
jgi:hypothetical protein